MPDVYKRQVFVLSNGIFLTSGDEKETQFAKVLQIPVNVANLSRVAEVNQLSRQIEAGRFTPEEAKLQLERIENTPGFSNRIQIISAGFSGACFSFMFGGALQDFFCSIWIGMKMCIRDSPHTEQVPRDSHQWSHRCLCRGTLPMS